MPLDYSLLGQAPKINTPFENLSQILQVRNQQEAGRSLAEQRRAQAAQTDEQTAILKQKQADLSAIDAAGMDLSKLPAHLRPVVEKQLREADEWNQKAKTAKIEAEKAELGYAAHLASGVLAWEKDGPEALMNAAQTALQVAKSHGHDVSQLEQIIAQDPTKLKPMLDSIIAQHQGPQAPKPPVEVNPGNALVDPQTGKVVYSAPAKEPEKPAAAKEYEYAVSQGFKGTFNDYQNTDANRRRSVVTVNSGAGGDADSIADAIMSGNQPPLLTGLYRLAGPVRAALAKKGYNLTNATLDYNATTKHLSTLNGQQQTRLRQAVDVADHSLDVIDSLAEQWKGGRFPLLNKASLIAAKNGALGKEAQQIATQLNAQITDLTSELGNVYMGGNSPTDHALKLAGQNLSADWSMDTLKSMTKLARTNLGIRRNSMDSVGVAGASAGNIYAPTAAAPAEPQPSTGNVDMVAPDGRKLSVPAADVPRMLSLGAKKAGG
jgi:hypothetical protein